MVEEIPEIDQVGFFVEGSFSNCVQVRFRV